MKQEKGFTLVELIIVLALIGLILVIAFPALQGLTRNNEESQFETYEKLYIEAAKLYIDKEQPVAVAGAGGCLKVTTQVLRSSELIKYDTSDKDVMGTCTGSIWVTRGTNNALTYEPSIQCTFQKGTSKEVVKSSANYPLENKKQCRAYK